MTPLFLLRCIRLAVATGLGVAVLPVMADPDDFQGGQPEAFTASGQVSGTLLPGVDDTVVFAALGDYGAAGSGLEGISAMIRGWDPAFIISTGDNTYGVLDTNVDLDAATPGNQNAWEFNVGNYFGAFIQKRVDGKFPMQVSPTPRFFPTVGNHDSAPDAGNGGTIDDYLDYFYQNPGGAARLPEDRGAVHSPAVSYYVLRRGPVDLFMLDADVLDRPDLLAAQKAWLTSEVAASTARWKLGAFHQPPLTSGFRAAASWMLWDELKLLDAILCGHDHFYERLDYFGVPLIITGAGGQFLYGFRSPPDQRSLVRYNAHHSAMRIVADSASLRLESRAFELPARQETLVEALVLGTPAPVDNEDAYTFFMEAGETLALRTATLEPLSQPALAPVLTLFTPGGQPVTPDRLTSPDGRNVLLTHQATLTGRWQAKISAPPPGRGAYTLRLTIQSPLPDYPAWSQSLPDGQREATLDPDRDGLPNLLEFALGTTAAHPEISPEGAWQGLRLEVGPAAGTATLTFDLPSPLPPGISYQIESSSSLAAASWTTIAWRGTGADWQGAPNIGVLTGSPLPEARRIALTIPVPPSALRQFFRLTVTRNG